MLTPGISGADGISAMSRLVVEALQLSLKQTPHLDVLSLAEASRSAGNGIGNAGCRFRGAAGSKLRFAALALRAIRESADTRIICMHLHLAPVLLPLVWRGARVIILLHGIEAWKPLSRMERLALSHASLIAVSEHTVHRFLEFNPGFRNRPIEVCHPGLRENGQSFLRSKESETKPFLNQQPFALLVGRMPLEGYKGHDLLLEMWPSILAEVPDAFLYFVGDGHDRSRLEAKSAALGLANRVRFTGKVSDELRGRLYHDCTFFIMPSRQEGFGLVFLEAMQAEKACIGAIGAAAEIIEDGVTGFVVDPDRPAQVRDAVLRLFKEPQIREKMGRAGAKRQAEEFSEEQFRRRFRALIGFDH